LSAISSTAGLDAGFAGTARGARDGVWNAAAFTGPSVFSGFWSVGDVGGLSGLWILAVGGAFSAFLDREGGAFETVFAGRVVTAGLTVFFDIFSSEAFWRTGLALGAAWVLLGASGFFFLACGFILLTASVRTREKIEKCANSGSRNRYGQPCARVIKKCVVRL